MMAANIKMKRVCSVLLLGFIPQCVALAEEGFFDGASLNLNNRFVFEQLYYKRGDTTRTISGSRSDRARESGLGLMLEFRSGFTPGVLGFGLDAHAYAGFDLGSSAKTVRSSPRYVSRSDEGLEDGFARVGGALKLRISQTELRYGEMRTSNPIFHSSDSRLLPETQRGWLLTSKDVKNFDLQAGHFNRWADRNARKNGGKLYANYSGVEGKSFSFMGGNWKTPLNGLSLSSYYGRYEDAWNTWYVGGYYSKALSDNQSVSLSLNLYRNTDTGEALAGEVNNTTWSLMAGYSLGPHKFGLGYQKVHGDTPFDYVNRGSIWLENAMQLSDFNAPNEQSWQIKYDIDLAELITPGLSAGIAYTRGSNIDYSKMNSVYAGNLGMPGSGGKHWERDIIVRYTVPEGRLKGMKLQARYSTHRANKQQGELNVDQVKMQLEMPINIL